MMLMIWRANSNTAFDTRTAMPVVAAVCASSLVSKRYAQERRHSRDLLLGVCAW